MKKAKKLKEPKEPKEPPNLTLRLAASAWLVKVESELNEHGISLYRVKQENQIRLLRIKCWVLKYEVSLAWVISRLLLRFGKVERLLTPRNLCIGIATLTGAVAEQYLQECMIKEFPHDENRTERKEELKRSMLAIPILIRVARTGNIDNYVQAYQTKAQEFRNQLSSGSSKFKRPFRNNPFQ